MTVLSHFVLLVPEGRHDCNIDGYTLSSPGGVA